MFDNWKLFYLGKDTPEAINEIAGEKNAVKAVFNLAGQQMNGLQKGLNIVDGKKVFVK
jgi:myo-inositol-hexaphosphate 3-phosphohydrolase